MSGLKDFGGCAWKVFQLGIVVAILGLGFLFIAKPQGKGREEYATKDLKGERSEERLGETGLVAKLRQVFGGDKKAKVKTGSGSKSGSGRGPRNKLKRSQKDAGTGHVDLESLLRDLEDDGSVQKEMEFLAEGTTQIQQVLYWQIFDGNIYYRILLQPYDRTAHELMIQPGEALFMSFMSGEGTRLVPKSADYRIDMKYLRVATKDGYAVGWFYDGVLPLDGVHPEAVSKGKVGWIFSNRLHARLRQLQAPKRPADEARKPFSIEIPVDGQGPPTGR